MAAAVAKQFLLLGGVPMLSRTLEVFDESPLVEGIIVAVGDGERQRLEDIVLRPRSRGKPLQVVAGGSRRQESVSRAL
jgi:2-C-methyl-D-erythritol 4-phosphate cytidylyltransferase